MITQPNSLVRAVTYHSITFKQKGRYVCPGLALPECWSDPFGFGAIL